MSKRYKGSILSATPPTLQTGAGASGAWTVDQQMQANAAGKWPTNGPYYVEDVFSTYLYTGNNTTQTIDNGIDLAGKGGLVWIRQRTAQSHALFDTARGAYRVLRTNENFTQANSSPYDLSTFNSNGFTLQQSAFGTNASGSPYASWTFRKQPKFFDVVTYTGNGSARTIAHNLGSVPGCIIIKCLDNTYSWQVYHVSAGNNKALSLNTTNASFTATSWNNTTPTDTVFSLGSDATVNASGSTYVAYLFAHDAGGFGPSGTDNVISCGSYTGNGSTTGPTVTLNYEPQWLMIKRTDSTGDWVMFDNMRGLPVGSNDALLYANATIAEGSVVDAVSITATGFSLVTTAAGINASGGTYIYIAIRRPMKPPTDGTKILGMTTYTGDGNGSRAIQLGGVAPDLVISKTRNQTSASPTCVTDRLRGGTSLGIVSVQGDADSYWSIDPWYKFDTMNGYYGGGTAYQYWNSSGVTFVDYGLKRAPGFFDIVSYTGTGSTQSISHNLGVAPELIIAKRRSSTNTAWFVYSATYGRDYYALLNAVSGFQSDPGNSWGTTNPTATTFSVSAINDTNASGGQYIAYLFASCPGVSKVGSYTGNGTSLTVNCGFVNGARFVVIKRADLNGTWFVYDTARGIVAGNDPVSALNNNAAENTLYDAIDPDSSGFIVNQLANDLNVSGGTYIYLAIA